MNADSNLDIDKYLKQSDFGYKNKSERKKGPSLYKKIDPKLIKLESKMRK